jgi:hypothetical protein
VITKLQLINISYYYYYKEESIKAVKHCEGVLIKRSVHQSPDHSVPSAKAIYKHGEIYKLWEVTRLRVKCDGTRAKTRFRLSAKRTSPRHRFFLVSLCL